MEWVLSGGPSGRGGRGGRDGRCALLPGSCRCTVADRAAIGDAWMDGGLHIKLDPASAAARARAAPSAPRRRVAASRRLGGEERCRGGGAARRRATGRRANTSRRAMGLCLGAVWKRGRRVADGCDCVSQPFFPVADAGRSRAAGARGGAAAQIFLWRLRVFAGGVGFWRG